MRKGKYYVKTAYREDDFDKQPRHMAMVDIDFTKPVRIIRATADPLRVEYTTLYGVNPRGYVLKEYLYFKKKRTGKRKKKLKLRKVGR